MTTDRMPDFSLALLTGGEWTLSRRVARGAVVVFWSAACSHCRRYDAYLGAWRRPQLPLVAVACREGEDVDSVRGAVAERALDFPIVWDGERDVARRWGVQHTPRAYLVDRELRWRYRGAIDNFLYPSDSGHQPYLEQAVRHFLAGAPVARPETPSFGCPIESVYYATSTPSA